MKFNVRIVEKTERTVNNKKILVTKDFYNVEVEANTKQHARKVIRSIEKGKYANNKYFRLGRITPKRIA